ncbi:MAG: sulfatase-like hydrolase/transferase [Chitinivibrionales bacterium]|nr:sulfatase-like hydrolase/transferase [Chitinivibrionales bacterium]
MKILFIDIDTLRPDHLGCYGYHRNTSPSIDRIAADAIRFDQCYVPDAPCLPSRAALHFGRFGIHTGAINHAGRYADPHIDNQQRGFQTNPNRRQLTHCIQKAGYHTSTVSSFAGRHSAWWFLARFNDVFDCGRCGGELSSEVLDQALEYMDKYRNEENWYLHFNIWDPHTPYRVPEGYGNPFENDSIAGWVSQEMIDKHQNSYGPHSANAVQHNPTAEPLPREVSQIRNLADYKKWIDGYDVGIRHADDAIGRLLARLDEWGIYEQTAIVVTSDHGENQGELNVYGDHQNADLITNRVPMLVKWPGIPPRIDDRLHYQFDITATMLRQLGCPIPEKWDAGPIADSLAETSTTGRDYLVVSQAAWSCQRAVIFDEYILIKTYADGLKEYPELMLFHRFDDPHELHDLAGAKPDTVRRGLQLLQQWIDEQMDIADVKEDPMLKVIQEGGPSHTRYRYQLLVDYYLSIDREDIAQKMIAKYQDNPLYH